jgi:hypothetical protein
MRNIKQIVTIIVLGFAVVLNSCSDFMDIVPSTSYTEEMVFPGSSACPAQQHT